MSIIIDETWKPVACDDRFEISSDGQLRRLRPCERFPNRWRAGVVKPTRMMNGYFAARVGGKVRYIHHLVAEAFIGARLAHMTVNHINCVKTDNRVSNLEYVTQSENMKHAWRSGCCVSARGERAGKAKLTEEQVHEIRAAPVGGKGLAKKYGVTHQSISAIRNGTTWKNLPTVDTKGQSLAQLAARGIAFTN